MSATKSHRGRNLTIWIALIVVIAAVFGFRFQQLDQTEAMASIRSVQDSEGIPVEFATVVRADLSRWTTLAGTVEGEVQYPVVSQNALAVVDIPVSEGDRVQAGDVIIRLASGAPSPMYHSLDRARASYEKALTDVKRLRNLFAEGAVSESELDAAETALKVYAADLQDARDTTVLTASQAGVVSAILVEAGQTVSAGKPLAWIIDTAQVKIRFSAGGGQARDLATGQLVRLEHETGEGRIARLDLMADPKTHLLEGEALLPDPDGTQVPGLLLSFRVRTAHRPNALAIPAECLVATDGGDAVWILSGSGEGPVRARLAPVTIGLAGGELIEVLDGLTTGDRVVQFGQTLLTENALVKVLSRTPDQGEDR